MAVTDEGDDASDEEDGTEKKPRVFVAERVLSFYQLFCSLADTLKSIAVPLFIEPWTQLTTILKDGAKNSLVSCHFGDLNQDADSEVLDLSIDS